MNVLEPLPLTGHDLRKPELKEVDDENGLKIDINTFVWMHAPGALTLERADELACKIFCLFLEARKSVIPATPPSFPEREERTDV